jgi:hypothetical protein
LCDVVVMLNTTGAAFSNEVTGSEMRKRRRTTRWGPGRSERWSEGERERERVGSASRLVKGINRMSKVRRIRRGKAR